MPSLFSPDQILLVASDYCRVVEVNASGVMLRSAKHGNLREESEAALLDLYTKGELVFTNLEALPEQVSEQLNPPRPGRSLDDYAEPLRKEAYLRWKYLSELAPGGVPACPKAQLPERLKCLTEKLNPGGRVPSVQSFYRWRCRYRASGEDIRSLVPRTALRGQQPKSDYPERLIEIINEGIQRVYLNRQAETKVALRDWIHAEIKRENLKRAKEEALPLVTMKVIQRILDQRDQYVILKRRYGDRIARQRLAMFSRGPQCDRVLQRVEVDNSPLDIVVIDEITRLVLGRPWITAMVDRYSRMLVGFHISFRKPSVESVLRCLRHALLPKTYVREKFPAIKQEWPCFGRIEQLVCDNGLEFHALDLETACADLGIHLIYCEPRAPFLKGVIERFLKTLNYSLTHSLPGTTFAKYDKRGDYKTEANAVLTLAEFNEVLHRWIVDIYAQEFHRGIDCAPLTRWQESVQEHPPALVPDPNQLRVYLSCVETRQLDKDGIQLKNLNYSSPELESIRGTRKSVEVTCRYDPNDLGTIHVLDSCSDEYIEVPCTQFEYASGLRVEQHELINKRARMNYASMPLRDALLVAKQDLREFTEALLAGRLSKTKKQRREKDREVLQNHADNTLHTSCSSVQNKAKPAKAPEKDAFDIDDWLGDMSAPIYSVNQHASHDANNDKGIAR